MYALEGVSSVANFITAYEISLESRLLFFMCNVFFVSKGNLLDFDFYYLLIYLNCWMSCKQYRSNAASDLGILRVNTVSINLSEICRWNWHWIYYSEPQINCFALSSTGSTCSGLTLWQY